MKTRRDFIKKTTLVTAGIAAATPLFSANQYRYILNSNDVINAALIGVRGRGKGLTKAIGKSNHIRLTYNCDVDHKVLQEHQAFCSKEIGYVPKEEKDFRKILENKDIDAVFIATPEHWHAPMAIMAMQAGKDVYVEKPCSHNPHENELIVSAQKTYNKVVQMGNQQRSARTSMQAVQDIREGIIGDAYAAKAWYSNSRGSIGIGKEIPVPDTLDWELWQGPAPRKPFKDNIHPYNWHWFRHWGTGEIHNNGTHELDICRWALGVAIPSRVTSSGGRLHFSDDWEFFDTQKANYEFQGGKLITWEGNSCNAMGQYGNGRGSLIQGTKGSILLDRGKYQLFDLKGRMIKEKKEKEEASATTDTVGFDTLTVDHVQNFVNAIHSGESLHSPIKDAALSTMLCHYGNIALNVKRSLQINVETGKIVNDQQAMSYWKRRYEKGWEPKL